MQKRAEKTRQRICEVSLRLFAEKGFHGTKIDAIAAEAKVNKQRIYAYFGSKKKLFAATLEYTYESIVFFEKDFLLLSEADIPVLTERILRSNFKFHYSHPYFWRILAWSNLEESSHIDVIKGLRSDVFAHLKKLYSKGQRNNIFKKGVSFEAYYYSLSALSFFYFSNMKTMSKTLNMDLSKKHTRERIIKELLIIAK